MSTVVKPSPVSRLADAKVVLSVAATIVVAAMVFAAAFIRPENGWDGLAYAALAKQMRGEEGHRASYAEMKGRIDPELYRQYTAGPYREKMAQDSAYFQENMTFYASKPAYVAAVSLAGRVLGSDFLGMYFVGGLSTAIAVLVSLLIAIRLLPPDWLPIVPVAWLVGLGFKIAILTSPDAMAICFQLLFLLLWLRRKDGPLQFGLLIAVGAVWVATRANALLFIGVLACVEVTVARFERATLIRTGLLLASAIAVYKIIVTLTGNHGQLVLFNFVFVDKPDGLAFPNPSFHLVSYMRAIVYGLFEAATHFPEFFLCIMALCWIAFEEGRPLLRGREPKDQEMFVLVVAMLLAIAGHFLLYPAAWERFFVGYYIMTMLLLARFLARDGRVRAT